MSELDKQNDWTTPAALAIPKEGFFALEQGRFGPVFPKTPACYGFSVIAKVKPGREQAIRDYGKNIEAAEGRSPRPRTIEAALSALGAVRHRLRHCYFMYQGIFDTDFDKYTEDAVALFSKYRNHDRLREPRRVSQGLEDKRHRRSWTSSASTSVRASWSTASIRT